MSDSRFKQLARKKAKAPPPLFSKGAGCAGISLLPKREGAERRKALVRNAAPIGPSCDRTGPSSGRELPAHDADRRAFRRSTAAFFLSPRDRLLETDRGAHSNAFDSTGFPLRSSAPTSPLPDGPT